MLHTKFESHRSFGSREDDLLRVFLPYMGMVVNSVMFPHLVEATHKI